MKIARSSFGPALLVLLFAFTVMAGDKKENKAKKKSTQPATAEPYLASVFPCGAQRGTTIPVTITGRNLRHVTGIRITGDGISARLTGTNENKSLSVEITVTAQAQPGGHDLRILSPGGASNRAQFIVEDFPEVTEVEPNSTPAQAQQLSVLPTLINGQIFMADRDLYRFRAQAGQTFVCTVQARSLLPYIADAVPGWFDACLTVYDHQGRRLNSVDDHEFRPDPVLFFTAPSDGDYLMEINDILFRGREDFVYRLTIGELPYVTHVFPLGGREGSETILHAMGINMPKNEWPFTLAKGAPGIHHTPPPPGGLWHNTLPLASGNAEELMEKELKDETKSSLPIPIPTIVNGRIDHPGDTDEFVIQPKRNQRLVIEIFARRLHSPLDAHLTLLAPNGRELASNDDRVDPTHPLITHHADARIVHTFKQAGPHTIRLHDTQSKGGDAFAYRLQIGPETPDFSLRVTPDNPRVGPGETTLLTVEALRQDGFKEEIELKVKGLPEGFIASSASIPAGQNSTPLTITAPTECSLDLLTPTVIGQASSATNQWTRTAQPSESVMQAFFYNYHVPTRELLLSLVEPAPFTVVADFPDSNTLTIKRGGKIEIPVRVTRQDGIKGVISVTLFKPPPSVTARAALIQPESESGIIILTAKAKAKPGSYTIILKGTLRAGKESASRIAPAIALEVMPLKKLADTGKKKRIAARQKSKL